MAQAQASTSTAAVFTPAGYKLDSAIAHVGVLCLMSLFFLFFVAVAVAGRYFRDSRLIELIGF
jgi:hypothetical protein